MPQLSIIIPTLNEENYIQNILQDIFRSTLAADCYEIIVADSGSTDGTRAKVEILQRQYPQVRLKFIDAHPKGVSTARNTGAEHANGVFLVFLDADARIASDFLARNFEEMKYRKLDVAACYVVPDSAIWIDKFLFSIVNNFGLRIFQYSSRPLAIGAAIWARKDIHTLLDGFNPHILFGEDMEYVTEAKRIGRFRILNSRPVIFSMRRAQKDGRFTLVGKALHGFIYHLRHRCMRGVAVTYEYGKYK